MPAQNPAFDVRSLAAREKRRLEMRYQRFDQKVSQEPVWNMLLELTIAERESRNVAVKCLQIASGAPPSSALRWISYLEKSGRIRLGVDERDRRRRWVRLAPMLRRQIEEYLIEAERAQL